MHLRCLRNVNPGDIIICRYRTYEVLEKIAKHPILTTLDCLRVKEASRVNEYGEYIPLACQASRYIALDIASSIRKIIKAKRA